MERINIAETFYSATKDNHLLRDVFIEMGFKPMRDDKIYLSVGRIITLEKALLNIDMTITEANKYLKDNKMEVILYE